MQSDRTFEANGKTYTIRFGQNAMYLLESELSKLRTQGVLQPRKYSQTDKDTGATIEVDLPIDVRDLVQLPPRMAMQLGLWVGLEGGRRKYKTRPNPFTLDEAADIIDEADAKEVERTVIDCFRSAFPEYFPEDTKGDGAEKTEKNAQEEAVATGMPRSSRRSKSA